MRHRRVCRGGPLWPPTNVQPGPAAVARPVPARLPRIRNNQLNSQAVAPGPPVVAGGDGLGCRWGRRDLRGHWVGSTGGQPGLKLGLGVDKHGTPRCRRREFPNRQAVQTLATELAASPRIAETALLHRCKRAISRRCAWRQVVAGAGDWSRGPLQQPMTFKYRQHFNAFLRDAVHHAIPTARRPPGHPTR